MSSDIHALSGAYAVDALDDVERATFERHLAVCEACRAEVADLRLAATEIAATTETTPPPGLRASVLDQISSVRPLPPREPSPDAAPGSPASLASSSDGGGATVRRLPLRRRWARIGLAAAAAVLVVVGIGVAWQPWDDGHAGRHATPTAADRVIHAPDSRHWTADLTGGGRVTVYRSVALDKAVVVTHGLAAAPTGRTYELWLQTPRGAMRPAGLFRDGSDLSRVVRGHAGKARGVGITVEPAGGSQVPTSTPIALVELS